MDLVTCGATLPLEPPFAATASALSECEVVKDRKLAHKNRANGGESVSQSLLKDKTFSTFLDQNPTV
jgi:hypothetical protein